MVRHLAGVAEIVDDVDAAVAFYRDVLGVEVEQVLGDSEYVTLKVAGVLHFAVWSRKAAAEATYGTAEAVDKVPLGFTVGFEVDDVEAAAASLAQGGYEPLHAVKTEPWQQRTSRFITPEGSLGEIAETPWARSITQDVAAE